MLHGYSRQCSTIGFLSNSWASQVFTTQRDSTRKSKLQKYTIIHAALHWARKLVFTSFAARNVVPLKSEMHFLGENSEFSKHPDFRLGNTSCDWEIQVSEPNGTQQ